MKERMIKETAVVKLEELPQHLPLSFGKPGKPCSKTAVELFQIQNVHSLHRRQKHYNLHQPPESYLAFIIL